MSFAQDDSWKIYHNKRLVIETSKEDQAANVIKLQQVDLNKDGYILVTYHQDQTMKDWKRIIAVFDEKENELVSKENVSVIRLLHEDLKLWLKNASSLKIYTWSLPTDPDKAAAIRIRRKHLCTIELR